MANTTIEANDANKVIQTHDQDNVFVYADPPYVDSNQGHYGGYTEEHFRRLLETLSTIKGKFLLSSYRSQLLNGFIDEFGWFTKEIVKTLSVKKTIGGTREQKIEVLTANYPIE